ncbi:hypothetical protein C8Q75DRAFT_28394 [Abortiporus biennis]|nr:hypothetical protein C8Q75DRAFT_28394 [Abortiporus biennis]
MAAVLLSPQPRRASRSKAASSSPHLSPPIYMTADISRRMASTGISSPARLMSPIQLIDPTTYGSSVAPPSGYVPSKRRRSAPKTSRASRRKHCNFSDCIVSSSNLSPFESLPWIAHLHKFTPQREHDLFDIADLSTLPIGDTCSQQTSGIGPVRSPKSSLRSDPFSLGTPPSPQSQKKETSPPTERIEYPFCLPESFSLQTPPPLERFDQDDPIFLNLMPVSRRGIASRASTPTP